MCTNGRIRRLKQRCYVVQKVQSKDVRNEAILSQAAKVGVSGMRCCTHAAVVVEEE
jgi:hypothetical protein